MPVIIRPWAQADLQNLVYFANNINIWNNLRNYFPHPYTENDGINWLEKVAVELPRLNFAIDLDGLAVGGIGLILNTDVYIKSAEIGYWIAEPYWGKGIATLALQQMVDYTFYYFDIVRLYAEVFETNAASMRVLHKCGFHLEGIRHKAVFKNGLLMDDHIWVRFRH
jgi:RimJ/RimL family protein N-acetyltransferase